MNYARHQSILTLQEAKKTNYARHSSIFTLQEIPSHRDLRTLQHFRVSSHRDLRILQDFRGCNHRDLRVLQHFRVSNHRYLRVLLDFHVLKGPSWGGPHGEPKLVEFAIQTGYLEHFWGGPSKPEFEGLDH